MPITFGKLEHVNPHDLWANEATDFTPWLAEQLSLLGEALGLDLELIGTEQSVGAFACDIQARETGTNRQVIIENQLEATDHRHLGQLLTYAGGLDAAIVVWISTEIRDEHREALDWLNRHTDEQIDFFGVAIEPIRIDGSNPAVQFRPVAFPKRPRIVPPPVSPRYLAYQKFFQDLIDERLTHKFTNAKIAQPQSWYSFSSGIANIYYGASFAQGDRLRAEVYIALGDRDRNKAIFDWFFARKVDVDSKMQEPLNWERLDTRRASRISAVRQGVNIANVEAHAGDWRAWLIDRLLRLRSVFGPILPEVLAATENVGDDPALEPAQEEI